ncbi:MAG TPA: HPF/RaiA family ribosome-associated protein [Thermodesulfobacteriota bacterium]
MHVQVNTDGRIRGGESLAREVEVMMREAFARFADRITRLEVHLSDVNALKSGEDKRCVLEARLAGLDPVAASDQAETMRQAIDGATRKLERALDSTLGRLGQR